VGEVLEVAIGTGRNLPFYPQGVRLTGIDFSPAMLEHRPRRVAGFGGEVTLLEAGARSVAVRDASFDTWCGTLGLCGIPDDRKALGEMYRVLRPGGMFAVARHIGSHHRIIHFGQSCWSGMTLRMCGDQQTAGRCRCRTGRFSWCRRQERLKLGTVERRGGRQTTLRRGTRAASVRRDQAARTCRRR